MLRRNKRALLSDLAADESGVALIEMAIVTPFLLALTAGILEFSNVLYTRLLIETGVTDAARYAARCSDDQTTCGTRAKSIAVTGQISGGTARVAGWATSAVTVTYTSTPATSSGTVIYRSNTANVYTVQVSTTFAYKGVGFWTFLGLGARTLGAQHQERVIGW